MISLGTAFALLFPLIGLWLVIRQVRSWRASKRGGAETFLRNPDHWGAQ